LSKYRGKMGRLVNAGELLKAVAGAGSDMRLPNVYVAPGREVVLELSRFFADGENLSYACSVGNGNVATAFVDGTTLVVKGVAEGFTTLTVTAGEVVQTVNITVRNGAAGNGWL
jgi:hypothetical protein